MISLFSPGDGRSQGRRGYRGEAPATQPRAAREASGTLGTAQAPRGGAGGGTAAVERAEDTGHGTTGGQMHSEDGTCNWGWLLNG